MIYYLYDGSFSGFLTVIYDTFCSKEKPDYILKKSAYKRRLFEKIKEIETNKEKADKVAKAIKNKISKKSYKNIYYSFLSEKKGVELEIFYYLKLAFKKGKTIEENWANDRVRRIKRLSKKVGRERHKYLGLLRFRELKEGILYAPFEPDYNVLPILSNHFASRIKNYRWVIHDKSREFAVIYENGEWIMIDGNELPEVKYGENEKYETTRYTQPIIPLYCHFLR